MKKLLKTIKIIIMLAFLATCSLGILSIQGFVQPPVERVVVEQPQKSLNELLETVPEEYGIPKIIAQAIVRQESAGKMNAIRFEPSQMERARKITSDPEQQRMYASSHCAFQVMGWWTPEYKLKWSDLYDAETCANVGMAIFRKCWDRHAGKNKSEQIKGALKCYNGSDRYANEVYGRIAEELINGSL